MITVTLAICTVVAEFAWLTSTPTRIPRVKSAAVVYQGFVTFRLPGNAAFSQPTGALQVMPSSVL